MDPDRLARAYRASHRRRRQLLNLANGCFDGLWLGVLDRAAVAHLDESFYNDARDVLDGRAFTYSDIEHNLRGLRDWELSTVDAQFRAGGRVVGASSSPGRAWDAR